MALAVQLRDAGLNWEPVKGDAFALTTADMATETFVLSDMVVDLHRVAGSQVIGFNGTVEWALDSVEIDRAVWLPWEHQLRAALGPVLLALRQTPSVDPAAAWTVDLSLPDGPAVVTAPTAEEAYAVALLHLLHTGWGAALA